MDTTVVDASIGTRGQPLGTAAMIPPAYPPTDMSRPAAGAPAQTLRTADARVRTTPCAPRDDVSTVPHQRLSSEDAEHEDGEEQRDHERYSLPDVKRLRKRRDHIGHDRSEAEQKRQLRFTEQENEREDKTADERCAKQRKEHGMEPRPRPKCDPSCLVEV